MTLDTDAEWRVQVFGERCGKSWEISVVHRGNRHGQKSYGWINERKLLVGSSGGPCNDKVCGFVWDSLVEVAERLAARLNAGESIDNAKEST